jgi:glyoxylate reductase
MRPCHTSRQNVLPDSDEAPGICYPSNWQSLFDNIDADEWTRRNIPVGNTPGVLTETTADLTWALILAASRQGDR